MKIEFAVDKETAKVDYLDLTMTYTMLLGLKSMIK